MVEADVALVGLGIALDCLVGHERDGSYYTSMHMLLLLTSMDRNLLRHTWLWCDDSSDTQKAKFSKWLTNNIESNT